MGRADISVLRQAGDILELAQERGIDFDDLGAVGDIVAEVRGRQQSLPE